VKKRNRNGNYNHLKYKFKDKVVECEKCGVLTSKHHLHHKDFNPNNDEISNLEFLCVECHLVKHGKKYYSCGFCGVETNKRQKYCPTCNNNKGKLGVYCQNCGAGFLTKKSRINKCCSRSCHISLFNKRRKRNE